MNNQYETCIKKLIKISSAVMLITFAIHLTGCKDNEHSNSAASISDNWQLFVDDYWIADSANVVMKLHQPQKHPANPLIRGDVPWEQAPYCFGTVIYDKADKVFKIWYQSYNFDQPVESRTPVLYAISDDGINWKRPKLGIYDFQGSKDNNIILNNYGYHDLYSPSVIKDTVENDPQKRYKMIWWDYLGERDWHLDAGMCAAFSADGIHWNKYPKNPVLRAKRAEHSISDVMSVMQDKGSGKYVAYTKGWKNIDTPNEFRQIVRTESSDFIHWSEPQVVLTHKHNINDPQSYGMPVSRIGNLYLGLISIYKKPGDETIDIQLTVSHDNIYWKRCAGRRTFIPLGEEGSWDDGMIFAAPLFNYGDKTYIYYGGWDGAHNTKTRSSGIGLAVLPKNRFSSLSAGGKQNGIVTTYAIENAQGRLFVNVNAENGSLAAEILNNQGEPTAGYGREDCIALSGDHLSAALRWKEHTELPPSDKALKIRFFIKNADLFGFYAGENAIREDK